MTRSHFVRRVPLYPERFVPVRAAEAHLERRVPVRPARFVVGLEEPEELWPPEVRSVLGGAPLRPAVYLGRVEEIGPGGELTATVWETPSGREAVTTLAARDLLPAPAVHPERPQVGDLLKIWTWIELREDGGQQPRVVFDVVPNERDDEALEEIDEVIAALKEGSR